MKHLFRDKNNQLCGAKTWFTISSCIILFRFLVADLSIFGVDFPIFDSTGAALLVGAFGGVYYGRSKEK